MKWDRDRNQWYLNLYDKNLTWKTNSSFPKPKNVDGFFKTFNKKYKIDFKVLDFDYYNAK